MKRHTNKRETKAQRRKRMIAIGTIGGKANYKKRGSKGMAKLGLSGAEKRWGSNVNK